MIITDVVIHVYFHLNLLSNNSYLLLSVIFVLLSKLSSLFITTKYLSDFIINCLNSHENNEHSFFKKICEILGDIQEQQILEAAKQKILKKFTLKLSSVRFL